jgi:predicted transcriptional regulator
MAMILLYRKGNDKRLRIFVTDKKKRFKILEVSILAKISFGSNVGVVIIKRRSRTDIVVDILKVTMNGAKKTHIVYEVNLNFNIAQKYLEMLSEKELVRRENGLFITTDKGKVYQEIAKELKL